MEANLMQSRARHQSYKEMQQLQRRHDELGGAVAV